MLIERAQLMDDWERIDEQLAKMLAPNLVEGQMSREFFHTEDNVNIFVGIKSELTKVERKLLKNRDMEAQKLQARNSYDHFAAILCSLAQCCDRIRWLCPHANVSTAAFLEILREKMPPAPEGSGMKEKGRFHEGGDNGLGEAGAEGEWMVAARTAVVQALWDRCCFGLPEHSVLPMALHLAIGSSIPHQAVQGIFARVLLQCPAADKRILASELPEFCKVGAATFTVSALQRAVKQFVFAWKEVFRCRKDVGSSWRPRISPITGRLRWKEVRLHTHRMYQQWKRDSL